MTAATVAANITAIVADLNALLKERLGLTYSYKTDDPRPGESYGLIGLGSMDAIDSEYSPFIEFTAPAFIRAGYAQYAEAVAGGYGLMMALDSFIASATFQVDKRGVLHEVSRVGVPINPEVRAAIKTVDGQSLDTWVVEVTC